MLSSGSASPVGMSRAPPASPSVVAMNSYSSAGAGGAHAAKQPMLERVLGGQDVDATLDLVQANKTSLSIASVLGLFLLAINGAMTMGLRSAVHGQGRGGGAGGGGSYQRVEMIRS